MATTSGSRIQPTHPEVKVRKTETHLNIQAPFIVDLGYRLIVGSLTRFAIDMPVANDRDRNPMEVFIRYRTPMYDELLATGIVVGAQRHSALAGLRGEASVIRIGQLELWPIIDGRFTFAEPPGLPHHDELEFAPHRAYITEDHLWRMDIGGFLVRSGDRLVLIDAGAGQGDGKVVSPRPYTGLHDADPAVVAFLQDRGLTEPDQLQQSIEQLLKTDITTGAFGTELQRAGFRPEDVTDVVLSHLHFDHIGWVSVDGRPYFPNATYRVERGDIDYFLDPQVDDSFYQAMWDAVPTRERMAPVLDRLEPWDGDTTVTAGIDCRHAPGHTPGSSIVVLSSEGDRALLLGDTVHCPAELIDPSFTIGADMDQARGDQIRAMIRQEVEDGTIRISAPHFPRLQFGRLVLGEGRRSWVWDGLSPAL
jgi:glyoxylase-like metal-dependent hydrolase (beta-lactamase superfamily II)